MTKPLRLLFDDCLSRKAVEALESIASYSGGAVEFAHLAKLSLSGEKDDDWIPKIKGQHWIVVTTDRGKNPSRGGKLPFLCQQHDVTHVMLSGTVHKRNTFDKMRAIFGVWPELVKLPSEKPGSGFVIQAVGGKTDSVKLVKASDSLFGTRKVQTELF